ncbi:hypothetical protein ACYATP_04920 [Lactobacillaceae bacterium Melli_B4]
MLANVLKIVFAIIIIVVCIYKIKQRQGQPHQLTSITFFLLVLSVILLIFSLLNIVIK